MPANAPYVPLSDLLAGYAQTAAQEPVESTQPQADVLKVGERGRQVFKQWRQTPPDQAPPVAEVFQGASDAAIRALSASDMDTFLSAVRPKRDEVRDQQARFWLHRYAEQAGDPDAAQFDIAKFAEAAGRGVLTGRAAEAWRKLAGDDGVLDEEEGASLLDSMRAMADATEGVGPDLSVGKAGVVSRVSTSTEGAFVVVSKRRDATDDLPVPAPGAVPASVLKESLPPGEHQVVSPTGATVPVLKPDPEKGQRYRGWYPAIDGEDGLARWAPVRTQRVSSVRGNIALEAARLADVEVVQGDHWALASDDAVVFSVPDGAKAPAGSVKLKRSVRLAPELSRESLTADKIDPELFQDPDRTPLRTHLWALLPDSPAIRDRLTRLRGSESAIRTSDGRILVFGISPDEAQAVVAPVRGGEFLTHEGRVLRDGQIDPAQGLEVGPDGEVTLEIGGRQVGFTMEFAPDGQMVTERVPTSSVSTAVTRFRVPIPEGRDPAEFAAELEAKGAQDLVVYARVPAAEGWQNASEWLFSDGIETMAVRTAGYQPAHNAVPVWVRSTDGLPAEPLGFGQQPSEGPVEDYGTFKVQRRDGGELAGRFAWQDGTLVELPDEAEADIVVRVREGRATVEVSSDSPDVTPALDARDSLSAGGYAAVLKVKDAPSAT